jgi:hypothetical protein
MHLGDRGDEVMNCVGLWQRIESDGRFGCLYAVSWKKLSETDLVGVVCGRRLQEGDYVFARYLIKQDASGAAKFIVVEDQEIVTGRDISFDKLDLRVLRTADEGKETLCRMHDILAWEDEQILTLRPEVWGLMGDPGMEACRIGDPPQPALMRIVDALGFATEGLDIDGNLSNLDALMAWSNACVRRMIYGNNFTVVNAAVVPSDCAVLQFAIPGDLAEYDGVIVIKPEKRTLDVFLETGVPVPPEHIADVKPFLRSINGDIENGEIELADDENRLRFAGQYVLPESDLDEHAVVAALESLVIGEGCPALDRALQSVARILDPDASAAWDKGPGAILEHLVGGVRQWAIDRGDAEPDISFSVEDGSASYGTSLKSESGEEYQAYVDVTAQPPTLQVFVYTSLSVPDGQVETVVRELQEADLSSSDGGKLELIGDEHRLRVSSSTRLPVGMLTSQHIDELLTFGMKRVDDILPRLRGDVTEPESNSATGSFANLSIDEDGSIMVSASKSHPEGHTKSSMRLTDTLRQWLKTEEWEEAPDINAENQTSSTAFGYTIDDFTLQCYFDASEELELFKLFMYFKDTKCPNKCLDEVQKYFAVLNVGLPIGSMHLIPSERIARFYAGIDVASASFEPGHIRNLLTAGTRTLKTVLPNYMAICFGGKTANEVLSEEQE